MHDLTLRRLESEDAAQVSALLAAGPSDYVKYFHPFAFDNATISGVITAASKDRYIALEVTTSAEKELAGFYMLRGFDEGYTEPMYGVFIGYEWRNRGLARLTLFHAEVFCRMNGIERLLLKVHPSNTAAKALYESLDFAFVRVDPTNENLVLVKALRVKHYC